MVSQRLAQDPYGFFSSPATPLEPVPPIRPDLRPTSQKIDYQYSRLRPTTTTFGLRVKIPVTIAILIWPLLLAARDIYFGYYEFSPYSAADFFFNAITFAVTGAITVSLWRRGRL
ncbi:MAG TPA: hypothetical protein VLL08_18645 [Kineosporiaceae bacterium]|nr:hypothetical protein [Kineosporiaceae bacterium]